MPRRLLLLLLLLPHLPTPRTDAFAPLLPTRSSPTLSPFLSAPGFDGSSAPLPPPLPPQPPPPRPLPSPTPTSRTQLLQYPLLALMFALHCRFAVDRFVGSFRLELLVGAFSAVFFAVKTKATPASCALPPWSVTREDKSAAPTVFFSLLFFYGVAATSTIRFSSFVKILDGEMRNVIMQVFSTLAWAIPSSVAMFRSLNFAPSEDTTARWFGFDLRQKNLAWWVFGFFSMNLLAEHYMQKLSIGL